MILLIACITSFAVATGMTPPTLSPNGMPIRPFTINTAETERQMMKEHDEKMARLTDRYIEKQRLNGAFKDAQQRLNRDLELAEINAKVALKERFSERGNQPQYRSSIDKWNKLENNRKLLKRMVKVMDNEKQHVDYNSMYSTPFKGDVRFPHRLSLFNDNDNLRTGPTKTYNKYIKPAGDKSADNYGNDGSYWANKYFRRH